MDLLSIAGALFGGIGGIVQKYMDHKQKMQELEFKAAEDAKDRQHDLDVIAAETDKIRLAGDQAIAQKQIELQGQIESYATQLQISSVEADKATYSFPGASKYLIAVDVIRGLTRPWLTNILTYALIYIVIRLMLDFGLRLSPQQGMELMQSSIADLRFAATTAIFWWFGARVPGGKGKQNG